MASRVRPDWTVFGYGVAAGAAVVVVAVLLMQHL